MASIHQALALIALVAGALFALVAGVAAWRDTGHELIRRLAVVLVATFGVAAVIGLALLATGNAPRDGLHLLYGAALIAAVPVGLVFASEAPPRARSGVLAVAAVAALLIIWRLSATG